MDYTGWLQFQQALYRIVRDPLFELAITICIVLNTMFLAMEHHGMSESVLRALDIGNKVKKNLKIIKRIHKNIKDAQNVVKTLPKSNQNTLKKH